uniref:Basic tail secreted protein n=1 Tax=Rhipicephalus zambeziensis TaxID=60191 RepID=A0A224YCH5_9ACAR
MATPHLGAMLIIVFYILCFSGVQGIEFLDKKGECPGPGKNPGQPVQNCDYYCENGTRTGKWYRAHYEAGTECEYNNEVGMCLDLDGETSCYSPTNPSVEARRKKGSTSTKKPQTQTTKKEKNKKRPKPTIGTKPTKKPKDNKKGKKNQRENTGHI